AADFVRTSRRPAVLHLKTVRFMGHAGSDVELAYRSNAEIQADYDADPLLATARSLVDLGVATPQMILQRYEEIRSHVETASKAPVEHLRTAAEVMTPLKPLPVEPPATLLATSELRSQAFNDRLPESAGPMTLAMAINATLTDLMAAHSGVLVFGEDVARKG
ncbi:MAG: MFS transporter, partial [Nocardioidaceae bacterium]|nr:MFS transporter [Nocardioidaceae bacterium]